MAEANVVYLSLPYNISYAVIPAKAGIQGTIKMDIGSSPTDKGKTLK